MIVVDAVNTVRVSAGRFAYFRVVTFTVSAGHRDFTNTLVPTKRDGRRALPYDTVIEAAELKR
jgi:hypothetical protein